MFCKYLISARFSPSPSLNQIKETKNFAPEYSQYCNLVKLQFKILEITLTLLLHTPAILVDLLREKNPEELVVMNIIFKKV